MAKPRSVAVECRHDTDTFTWRAPAPTMAAVRQPQTRVHAYQRHRLHGRCGGCIGSRHFNLLLPSRLAGSFNRKTPSFSGGNGLSSRPRTATAYHVRWTASASGLWIPQLQKLYFRVLPYCTSASLSPQTTYELTGAQWSLQAVEDAAPTACQTSCPPLAV